MRPFNRMPLRDVMTFSLPFFLSLLRIESPPAIEKNVGTVSELRAGFLEPNCLYCCSPPGSPPPSSARCVYHLIHERRGGVSATPDRQVSRFGPCEVFRSTKRSLAYNSHSLRRTFPSAPSYDSVPRVDASTAVRRPNRVRDPSLFSPPYLFVAPPAFSPRRAYGVELVRECGWGWLSGSRHSFFAPTLVFLPRPFPATSASFAGRARSDGR